MMERFNSAQVCNFAENYGIYNARISENTPIAAEEDTDDGLGHKMSCRTGTNMAGRPL